MYIEKSILSESLKETVIRIYRLIDDYYVEYYIEPDEHVCTVISDYLYSAFNYLKDVLYSDALTDEGFLSMVKSDFLKGDETTKIVECLETIRDYIYSHYNEEIVDDTEIAISMIAELGKSTLGEENLKKIDEIKDSLNYISYFESHKEYNSIKYLLDLDEILRHDVFLEHHFNITSIIGIINVLEEFERKLKNIISTIKDVYLRSAILYWLKDYITIEKFKKAF